jgi:hypothetical protein
MRWLPLALALGCRLGVTEGNPDGNGLGVASDAGTPVTDGAAPTGDDLASATPNDLASGDLGRPTDLSTPPPPRASPIAAENARAGSTEWKLTASSAGLAAFVDRQSYLPGERVTVRAAANAATTATWELWRLGYYGGTGGRRVATGGPVAIAQAAPAVLDATNGSVHAPWAASFTIGLDASLPTGFYLVKLTSPTAQCYAPLVVREAVRGAPIVWPVELNTYQAYNAWGGTSLYDNRRGDWSYAHAFAVSFERPFEQGDGAGQLFFADRDFITFVEGQGWDLAYTTDGDVDADAAELSARRLVALEGHAEYWTAPARDHLEAAVAAGTNLVVFGANDVFWQVRWATPDRRLLIGYKEFAALDPFQSTDPAHVTTEWREPPVSRPENALLGEMFGEWLWSSAPLVVSDPSSWIWTGASVENGTMVWGLYGFEIDHRYANGAEPAGVRELGSGLAENHSGELVVAQATIYTAPSGATVFASGTVSWSQALAHPGIWDPRIQQATYNLFARLSGTGAVGDAPRALQLPPGPAAPQRVEGTGVSTVTTALTAPVAVAPSGGGAVVVDGDRVVRVDASGAVSLIAGGAAGDLDGPAAQAQLSGPRGLLVAADGTIFVADTGNHKIKQIKNGAVTTIAGSQAGFADGAPGALDLPMALTFGPGGVLLVVDTWNQRVRALANGKLSTWAGNGAEAVVDGPGASASFYFPFAAAGFPDGSVVIAESDDGLLRRVAPDAAHTVSTFAGELGRVGWDDGAVDSASLSELAGLAARADGTLVLLDAATYRVRLLAGGQVSTLAGGATSARVDGPGATAGFAFPRAAAFAADGSLLVADVGNHALRRITLP